MSAQATADKLDGSKPLTKGRQETFANEYIIDSNGQQAAERAGFAAKSARVRASELVTNSNVWARICYLRDERLARSRKSAAEIIKELENLAFSRVTDSVYWNETGMSFIKDSDELTPEAAAAIESVQVTEKASAGKSDDSMVLTTKVKLHPKLPALINLGKEHGLFNDKMDHNHTGEVTVVRKTFEDNGKQPEGKGNGNGRSSA